MNTWREADALLAAEMGVLEGDLADLEGSDA